MEIPSKELLIELNHKQNLTFNQMAQKLDIPQTTLFRIFKSYNLKSYRKSSAWNSGKTCYDDKRILSGENHPRWKNRNKYYIEYKLLKKQMVDKEIKCNCGKLAILLHHIDKNTQNNSDENLLPVCRSCHTSIHNKMKGKTINYFKCLKCNKQIKIISNLSYKPRFCSLSCKGKYFYYKGQSLRKTNPYAF